MHQLKGNQFSYIQAPGFSSTTELTVMINMFLDDSLHDTYTYVHIYRITIKSKETSS